MSAQPIFNPGGLLDYDRQNHARWSLERACEAYCVARLHTELAPRESWSSGNTIGFNATTAIIWKWDSPNERPSSRPNLSSIERRAQQYAREFGNLLRWEREFDVKLETDDATKRMTLVVTMKP